MVRNRVSDTWTIVDMVVMIFDAKDWHKLYTDTVTIVTVSVYSLCQSLQVSRNITEGEIEDVQNDMSYPRHAALDSFDLLPPAADIILVL